MGKTKFENSLVGMKGGGGWEEEKYHSYRLGGGKLGGLPRRIPIFNPVALI